ncbi:hypothetical protein BKA82DRAFT_836768 [Pisolithus tinctorius]|uniref:Uncharacterized protein n=1 Tax=Pisolithus tinctorius Marx 270 TaxID=870435 RepID=A0A0C3PQD5_PISTI|nr:hypothetical protein BKA82DRAFT_836768 [Pisolithus tinctorius]KIO11206.1 hypothetical protein M404DRAFT_836768 [Pisolithus tinctorius Marx 270]
MLLSPHLSFIVCYLRLQVNCILDSVTGRPVSLPARVIFVELATFYVLGYLFVSGIQIISG